MLGYKSHRSSTIISRCLHLFSEGEPGLDRRYATLSVQGSGNNTSPGGHNYPTQLVFNWQNGTDSVRLTLTNPKLIASGSSTIDTNSTVIGHPEYMRISGNGALNVNVGGVNVKVLRHYGRLIMDTSHALYFFLLLVIILEA